VRVCFVTLDYPPFRSSGLTIYAESVTLGLAARGHNITVVAADRPHSERVADSEAPPQISIVRVPTGRTDWIGLGWQAARFLRARQADFDVVHFADVHFAYAYRGPFVASAFQSFRQRLTSNRGRPYHTSRRNYIFRLLYYHAARWGLERPSVRRARHLIMSSAATRAEFIDHYHVRPSQAELVYPGIDVNRFDALPTQAKARNRLGLPADRPVLLYVGFSTPRKGVEYLAQAMSLMQTDAILVMVGKWEAHYQERFWHAVGPDRSRVHVVGYVPDADLATYYAAADAFVFPTLLEGFGIPLVEAMACGLPVVTTTGGSASEVAGDAGLEAPPGDAAALASALDRLFTTPGLARQLGQAGMARARTMFDERRMAAEIEAIYQRVQD
jgi:glycosyltransferase involved in cell wall biosynthesis